MNRSATLCGLRDLYNFQLLGNTSEQLKAMRRGTKKALEELYAADAEEDKPKQADTPKEANKKEKEKAEDHSEAFMKALELKRQEAFYGEEMYRQKFQREVEERIREDREKRRKEDAEDREQEMRFLDRMMMSEVEEDALMTSQMEENSLEPGEIVSL